MFWHNCKYSCKVLFRNKVLLFWTFLFPILLGTFFKMAFSDIEKNESLSIIDLAIIQSEDFIQNEVMHESLLSLSKEGENQLFDISYVSNSEAQDLLSKEEISGYLDFYGDEVRIVVNRSGIYETIIRFVIDEIQSQKKLIETLIQKRVNEEIEKGNYEVEIGNILREVKENVLSQSVTLVNSSSKNMSYTMIEYYTLIAMACLYSSMISMYITNYKLANMKSVGKRIVVSPSHKISGLFGSLFASYFVGAIGLVLLFLYSIFALKVDYGTTLFPVIILASVGLLAGILFGVSVSVLVRSSEQTKTGVLVAISMFGSFLSGMMGITMKYMIDTNVPILNLINPVAMITDGLYSLYYYESFSRFTFNIVSLFCFSVFMILLSFRGLRRQKYDSL